MDRFVLRSVNLAELSHPPPSPPPSVSAALSFTPERCDIGSFKLLGWTLVITGTWNCLSHADLRCTSTCQRHQSGLCSRPTRHPAQLLSQVEECSVLLCFFFKNVTYCAMWWITQTAALSDLLPHANEKHMFFLFFKIWNSKWIHCGFPMCYSIKKPL